MKECKHEILIQKEWTAHGLLCRVVNNMMGNNNGYVRVLKGHPFFDVGYNKAVAVAPNKARLQDSIDEVGFGGLIAAMCGEEEADKWMSSPEGYVRIHGGLTYAERHGPGIKEDDPNAWWFGFDTAHSGDYSPMDLAIKVIMFDVAKDFPDLHGPDYIEKWKTYINRVRSGEMPRDFFYEASLEGNHYWTVEEVAAEVEKMAEQLSVIQLLGVKIKEGG